MNLLTVKKGNKRYDLQINNIKGFMLILIYMI